MQVCVNVDER